MSAIRAASITRLNAPIGTCVSDRDGRIGTVGGWNFHQVRIDWTDGTAYFGGSHGIRLAPVSPEDVRPCPTDTGMRHGPSEYRRFDIYRGGVVSASLVTAVERDAAGRDAIQRVMHQVSCGMHGMVERVVCADSGRTVMGRPGHIPAVRVGGVR